MFSNKKIGVTLAGVLLAATACISPCMAQDENENGPRCRQRNENNQEGRRHRRGNRCGRMRGMMAKNLPGAKEEMERHMQAMKAIREKIMALGKELKETVKNTEGKDAKKQVLEGAKDKLKSLASEIVDERINHAQKMLELLKANREQAVEKVTKMLMRAGAKHHQRMRGRGNNGERPEGMMRQRRFRDQRGQRNGQGTPGDRPQPKAAPSQAPEGAGGMNEKDLAAALEDALQ